MLDQFNYQILKGRINVKIDKEKPIPFFKGLFQNILEKLKTNLPDFEIAIHLFIRLLTCLIIKQVITYQNILFIRREEEIFC